MRNALVLFIVLFFCQFVEQAQAQDCTGPDADIGVLAYNEDYGVLQVCTAQNWIGINSMTCPDGDGVSDPCSFEGSCSTPPLGTTCADGTIYAGLSPDGDVPMFTTPEDAGQFSWNDGTLNNPLEIAEISNCMGAYTNPGCRMGEDNTAILVGRGTTPSPAPYVAAQYCYCLGKPLSGVCASNPTNDADAHGHDDWYLPAHHELMLLYVNLVDQDGDNVPGGPLGSTFNFDLSGDVPTGRYWSSSEIAAHAARRILMSTGAINGHDKGNSIKVRCVRKL